MLLQHREGHGTIHHMNLLESAREVVLAKIDWWRIVGAQSTIQWHMIRLGQKLGLRGPDSWRVRPRQVRQVLTARLRGSSDLQVFFQIFVLEEYVSLRSLENVSMVLDLGANVGYSSAYFLNCFPQARVLAVEPDKQNMESCRANLKPYGDRVTFLHGAVWSNRTTLSFSQKTTRNGAEWGRRTVQPPQGSAGEIEAWDMDSLIEIAGVDTVDLLKVDIEAAELAVFGETAKKWLPRVRNICIELHGPDCQETFFNALADFEYELEHSGELTICKNLHPRAVAH
jgi:FkbM family methyltransferase